MTRWRSWLSIVLTLGFTACLQEFAKAWEENLQDVLLPGYGDFRGEVDGTEDGYIVVSYRLPEALSLNDAIRQTREHITGRYPCYKVLREGPDDVVLRCAGGRPRSSSSWDEEYRIRLDRQRRRLVMFTIDSVNRPRYGEFVSALDDVAPHR